MGAQQLTIREVLRQPDYGLYVAGNSISLVGNWMQRTATGWLAWELTGQSFWVGMVVLADLVPALVVGPFGGVLADRVDRRRIMLVTQSALSLVALAMSCLAFAGGLGLAALLMLVALHGLLVGVNQPARLALIPSLVEPPYLPTAIAINSIVFNTARFIGPAAAGLLLASAGSGAVFLANFLSYLAFILSLVLMRPASGPPAGSHPPVLTEIAEGVRFVSGHPGMRPLFLLFIASAIAIRPVGELLPGLADQVFGGGPETLAMLSSSLGLGAVAAGFWTARQPGGQQVRLALAATLAAALAAVGLALAPSLPLALLVIALFGAALLVGGVSAQTLMQLAAPPQLRGRVMSLFGLVFRGGPALGAVLLGGAADLVGLRLGLLVGALGMIAAWLPIRRRGRQLREAFAPPPSS